ncbi:excalibur calcium-binding domain-containing protein [Streptomyces sp. KAU_LT]|uniref:excalibur calcium-binding domain-containing protein n=1 Tax=Streptomyces sp. KAU_LT TaxID=3046669 RepID=UPI0024B7EDDC|nr:excalibur calcium-binding domain-containing protein [Streptomyces sp. KAU_LT]MDI9834605.1 excalibur calcium-binding domain-containing protein [Streptomyces sp. KAU_LT]
MNPLRTPGALVAALALAALPATAAAHDGNHPFTNCAEAYASGYSDIPRGDRHYGSHLDRDGDGLGCDSPPAGFVPADDKKSDGKKSDDNKSDDTQTGVGAAADDGGRDGTDLAETGGSDSTPYIAAGGLVAVLAGGTVMLAVQRRRTNR